jgi:hypothetical protein
MGTKPKFIRIMPEFKLERCAFLKCGNCDNAAVYWKQVHVAYPFYVRKCDVCGEDGNIINGNGHRVKFAVRER